MWLDNNPNLSICGSSAVLGSAHQQEKARHFTRARFKLCCELQLFIQPSKLIVLGGTRSSKSTWMDSRRRGSFPTDSEPFARFEDHKLNAVVDSIKEGRDLDMKLNIIEEESEEQISSVYDQDEYITITTTAYGMTATITIEFGEEDLEEAAEGDEFEKPEGDDEQEDKEKEGF